MNEEIASPQRKFTGWRFFRLLFASAVAVFIGLIGFGMWFANLMTFAPVMGDDDASLILNLVMIDMFAGPFVAAGSLILGWIVFFFRPVVGIRIIIIPPILWGLSIFAIFFISFAFFDGAFDWSGG
ncbi:hypothetical protein [Hyphobacterium sp.]|uniref:hypothetical protein n=1 Tax=Hyphobacterium sp. TaxID=2004662 RepID=UPI003BAD99FE